jgi:hypothetical protein
MSTLYSTNTFRINQYFLYFFGSERVGQVQDGHHNNPYRSKKGVKVEQILIGSERVGRVQDGHHNNP